jgi:serine/threonine-protein kinase
MIGPPERRGPDEDRWSAVEDLFHRALAVDPNARDDWLEAACRGDEDLRSEVGSLLRAREAAGDQLESLVQRTAAELTLPVVPQGERRIGPYRLLRELGRGGMGVVHLAERADGAYEHRVAIKLIQGHLTSDEAHRRFVTERQILARLDHPSIARLLDGGTTEDGTPYLVMEHVDGQPIDHYCKDRQLDIDARLRLFLQVCEAVESAHRQLVVHRDLKPSNILVEAGGRPKLLDFGIAKLLDHTPEDVRGGATLTVERRMTPGYASPEQVSGGPITTQSDVFSLGAVLYTLLAGRPAFSATELTPAQLLDAVCRQDPPKPSAVARLREAATAGNDDAPAAPAPRRASRRRAHRLTGELDAIVMTALRKEPARRYPSVASLADDLRRHLEGLPVRAHSERWTYLTGKWIRRHAPVVAAAVVVVLALLAGLVARTVEAKRADREATRADREARTAERVATFLVSLLSEADPESARGDDPTVLEVVARGEERVEQELADEPLIQARLLHVIGQVYKQRGRFEPAERHLRRALDLRRRQRAAEGEIAETLEGLGDLLTRQTRLEEAEALLREALELRARESVARSVAPSAAETLLGLLLVQAGRLDEAEVHLRRAHAQRVAAYGGEHEDVAKSLNNIAWLLQQRGDLEAAAEAYEQALALKRRILPPGHPSLVSSLISLAIIRAASGDNDAALALRREALELTLEVYGERHPSYALALGEMASQLHDQARFEEAEAAYRQALSIHEELFPAGSLTTARTMNNLASLLEDRGDPQSAEPLFERSLAMRREQLGEDHVAVALALHNLGRVRQRLGRLAESEALLRESLAVYRRVRPQGHPDTGRIARLLGELLLVRGRRSEAEALLAEAVEIFAGESADHPERRAAEAALATAVGEGAPGR